MPGARIVKNRLHAHPPGPQIVFLRIIAPNLAPSLVAAWIFAFIVSFDEITVTIFLAGTYETVPKRMFTQLLERVDPTISAIATLLIAGSVVIVAVLTLLMQRAGLLIRGER